MRDVSLGHPAPPPMTISFSGTFFLQKGKLRRAAWSQFVWAASCSTFCKNHVLPAQCACHSLILTPSGKSRAPVEETILRLETLLKNQPTINHERKPCSASADWKNLSAGQTCNLDRFEKKSAPCRPVSVPRPPLRTATFQ